MCFEEGFEVSGVSTDPDVHGEGVPKGGGGSGKGTVSPVGAALRSSGRLFHR